MTVARKAVWLEERLDGEEKNLCSAPAAESYTLLTRHGHLPLATPVIVVLLARTARLAVKMMLFREYAGYS